MSPAFIEELIAFYKASPSKAFLAPKYAYRVMLEAIALFKTLPPLVDIDVPENTHFTVCGDVHGQFYDLLNIFKLNGMPSATNPYLFNGDFVDRGSFSIEIIMLFLCLKLAHPQSFHMLRGNHETINMNNIYGFKGEVQAKVDTGKSFDLFTEVFNWIPLGAVIGKKAFVTHGGLFSEDGVTLDDLRKIDRVRQPPETGLMCEMMWADPQPGLGRAPSKRGVGLAFGPDVTSAFLETNDLSLVIRSHEVKQEGYEVMHDGQLVTVFSAPNYCDTMGNKGAFITLDHNIKPTYTTFTHVEHPPIKPMAYANQMYRMGM